MSDCWIQTYSGKSFHFDKIDDPDQICLVDIAHALAHTCRYGGHANTHYSVAEHSLLLAGWFERQGEHELAAQACLHDATEAYLGDMVAPLKHMMPQFSELERRLAKTIFKKFGLPDQLDARVKEADLRILLDEKKEIFDKDKQLIWGMEEHTKPLGVQLQLLEAYKAKAVFYLALVYRFGQYE